MADHPLVDPSNSGSGTQNNAQGKYIAQGNARMYSTDGAPMYFDQRKFYTDNASVLRELSIADDAVPKSALQYRSHAIKKWLCPPGHEVEYVYADHQQICQQRLPETGRWILDRSEYAKWENHVSSRTLWVHGGPGFGKTYIASSVIEHLQQQDQLNRPFAVIYFYCRFSDAQKNTTIFVLQSLLLQSLQLRSNDEDLLSLLSSIRSNMVADTIVEDSIPALAQAFSSVVGLFKNVYCIVDGLDELLDPERFIKTLLSLQYPSKAVLKLLLLSRTREDIMNAFKVFSDVAKLPIKPSDNRDDIMLYLKARTLSMKDFYDKHPKLYKSLRSSIEHGVDGVFMWAKLVLDDIEKSFYDDDIVSIIEHGPANLGLLYGRIISKLNLADSTTPQRVLILLCASLRPLSAYELRQALEMTFENGQARRKPMLSRPLEDMLGQKCGNLVEWTPAIVAFKHVSSKQYLQSCNDTSAILGSDPANLYLVRACLQFFFIMGEESIWPQTTYNKRSRPILPTSTSETVGSSDGAGFVEYATSYWFEHIRKLSTEARIKITDEVVAFLSSNACLNWLEIFLFFEKDNVLASSSYAFMEALQAIQAANEKAKNTRHSSILTSWIDKFVPFVLDWGPVLVRHPWRLREIPLEALSMFIESRPADLSENRSTIRYLGPPPQRKSRHMDTSRQLLLHPDWNVAFTFEASHVSCISGRSIIESSRLAYKSIVSGFKGLRSLKHFMSSDSSTIFTIVAGRSSADFEDTYFIFSLMIASEQVPERAFAAAKLMGECKSRENNTKWFFNQDWYLSWYLLYRTVSGFALPDAVSEEWDARCIMALSFSRDCEILAIYCRDKHLSVFARGSLLFSLIPDKDADVDSMGIAATSPSGRFIALVINNSVRILDTNDQCITTLCSKSGSYAQEYWASFSEDGLGLVLFVSTRTELNGCKSGREAKKFYSEYGARCFTIWQAESLWKPGSYSVHNFGDVLDLGFWTTNLTLGRDGRDPNWPYYTEPAIWSRDGTSVRVISTQGPIEWKISDLTHLASKASGSFIAKPREFEQKELSAVLTDSFCNWLLVPGNPDKLIDLNAHAFDKAVYVPPSSWDGIDSFRLSHSHLFRGSSRGSVVTHVDLDRHESWMLRLAANFSTISLTRDDMLVAVGKTSSLKLNSVPESYIHFAEVVAYYPCRMLLRVTIPSYTSAALTAILHPTLMLLAFSIQHFGIYICDLEKPAVPKRLMEPLMDRNGNLHDPELFLFSECGGFLVWNDPSRLEGSNLFIVYEIETRDSYAISVDKKWLFSPSSFKNTGSLIYFSWLTDTGRLIIYRWDLRDPTKFERSRIGLLPMSHLESQRYERSTILVTDDTPWGILLNDFPFPRAALFLPRKDWQDWQAVDAVRHAYQEDESELLDDSLYFFKLQRRRISYLEDVGNHDNGDIDLDIEEVELDLDDYAAEHQTTQSSLMGKGPWVQIKESELLKDPWMREDECKSFRWVIDFFKDDTVTRIRAVTEGLVDKNHHFRVERAKSNRDLNGNVLEGVPSEY